MVEGRDRFAMTSISMAEGNINSWPPPWFENLMQSSANFLSRVQPINQSPKQSRRCNASISVPVLFGDSPKLSRWWNTRKFSNNSTSSSPFSTSGFPLSVRIDGLNSSSASNGGGGPAFVGQVFSMCDPSGTGLMAVTTHIQIPFLSQRTPNWIKKALSAITKTQKDGPVFRFFMDLSDAVAYVKRLNIPTGMVGACRLDVAYEHFKEKPHMFQFVPNKRQVKVANKLLRTISRNSGKRRLMGVPVFTAQNLNIAIATADGIKWYTPYFFDKELLDNILEASIDQHFHTLIQNRHVQRRRDLIDDNLASEVVEDNSDSLFEPPEVQEVLEEMGHPGIPLSVISKAAEIQLLDIVDRVLLGKRWLRKATGIQPKFPYLVESFEERSAASFLKSMKSSTSATTGEESDVKSRHDWQLGASENRCSESAQSGESRQTKYADNHFPFGDWLSDPWSKLCRKQRSSPEQTGASTRIASSNGDDSDQVPHNPLLPNITMVGISTSEVGQMSRARLKKTMEDLTRDLEQTSNGMGQVEEDKDPLFVANVGDYSNITKRSSI